jgi:DUF971 family protein
MDAHTTPSRLDLKKDKQLTIDWKDGSTSVYSLALLRTMCPCAACKEQRDKENLRKTLLKILPGNFSGEIQVLNAQLVGNYALQIEWSDNHGSGIYSWEYLREISPQK